MPLMPLSLKALRQHGDPAILVGVLRIGDGRRSRIGRCA